MGFHYVFMYCSNIIKRFIKLTFIIYVIITQQHRVPGQSLVPGESFCGGNRANVASAIKNNQRIKIILIVEPLLCTISQ